MVQAPSPSLSRIGIAYVGSRLPALSETFVYREFLGLRSRGHHLTAVSVHRPRPSDPSLAALAMEAVVVYSPATLSKLPGTFLFVPNLVGRAIREAWTADLPSALSRLKYLGQALMGLAVARRLRGRGISHVHAHMANVPATIALHLARGLEARFSFTGHAADLFVYRSALAVKLREAAFVAAISHWHQNFYRQIEPGADVPLVRCGVALRRPPADGGGEFILVVARLVAKKGIDLLLEAVAQLADPELRVRIVGDGPERLGLERQALALGIVGQIDFTGAQPHSRSLALIDRAQLVVLPCRRTAGGDQDGIPVVLIEAMAAERPVIAGSLPTIAELVESGRNGMLVPPDDVDALVRAIAHLRSDPQLRLRLGREARRTVASEFSEKLNLDRLEEAIGRAKEKNRAVG